MSTDSAWPVAPVLTTSYLAVLAAPPAYPATTLLTPRTCSNTPWTPQKQPPERIAVSVPVGDGVAASIPGAGAGPLVAGDGPTTVAAGWAMRAVAASSAAAAKAPPIWLWFMGRLRRCALRMPAAGGARAYVSEFAISGCQVTSA